MKRSIKRINKRLAEDGFKGVKATMVGSYSFIYDFIFVELDLKPSVGVMRNELEGLAAYLGNGYNHLEYVIYPLPTKKKPKILVKFLVSKEAFSLTSEAE